MYIFVQDNVLIELTSTRTASGDVVDEDDPLLVVHPNYVMDDEC